MPEIILGPRHVVLYETWDTGCLWDTGGLWDIGGLWDTGCLWDTGGYGCSYVHVLLNLFLVHPCDKKTRGGCEQACNKDGDNAKCSCEPGIDTLNADGKTCDRSKASILPN